MTHATRGWVAGLILHPTPRSSEPSRPGVRQQDHPDVTDRTRAAELSRITRASSDVHTKFIGLFAEFTPRACLPTVS